MIKAKGYTCEWQKCLVFFGEVIVRDSQELEVFSYNAMNCAVIVPKSVKGMNCSEPRGGMLCHSSAACEGRETLEAQNDVKPNALQRKIK